MSKSMEDIITTRDIQGMAVIYPPVHGVDTPYHCALQAAGTCPLQGMRYEDIVAQDSTECTRSDPQYCLRMASAIAHGMLDGCHPIWVHVAGSECRITDGLHRVCIASHMAACGHDPALPVVRITHCIDSNDTDDSTSQSRGVAAKIIDLLRRRGR